MTLTLLPAQILWLNLAATLVWLAAPLKAAELKTSSQAPKGTAQAVEASEKKTCAGLPTPAKPVARQDVYANVPFKSGEKAVYEARYYGVLVGYGEIEVRPPRRINGEWAQAYHAEGKTGDWYRHIFVAHDIAEAMVFPQQYAGLKFYLKQDEGKLFGRRYQREKWVEFDHQHCVVNEKENLTAEKKELTREIAITPGVMDVMGVIFSLRSRNFDLKRVETAPVYTSEKNWELQAHPVAIETVKVPAGTFKAVKLSLKTFIGQQLEQKGEVFAWFAVDHPNRPLVKISGDVKIGSVEMLLSEFTPGN